MKLWYLSKNTFFLDTYFFAIVLPILLIFAIWSAGFTIAIPGLIVGGFFLWSIFEYALHRWAFHGFLTSEHMIHHKRPTDYIGAPNWISIGSFSLAYGAFLLLMPAALASALAIGFSLGYLTYIYVHYRDHFTIIYPDQVLYEIREHHERHHHYAHGNYGITSDILDRLLQTKL